MVRLSVIGICIISIHFSGCSPSHHTPHRYMTHYYFNHQDVQVNDSLVLELTNRFLPDTRKDFLACDVQVVTSSTRKLLVHFMSLEISDAEKDFDRLHIYDYKKDKSFSRISPPQGLYGVYDKYYSRLSGGVEDYVSSGNRLKLEYHGKPTLAYDGFKILITSYRESRGGCGGGYFRCSRKDICIPVSTWCDGFNNCGNNDLSDESNCGKGLGDTWKPWDGQITAVVAASVACTGFLLTAGIILLVIMRINKREAITTNITVEFQKKRKTKRKSENGELLTRLYAPPSYEVVVKMDEDPPPYEAVQDEYDTDSDDGSEILNEHVLLNTEGACATTPSEDNVLGTNVRVTSALVTCDIEGNHIKTEVNTTNNDTVNNQNKEFQELSNYKLCSTAEENSSNQRKVQFKTNGIQDEIEVLSSEDTHASEDENSNSHNHEQKMSNGTANSHMQVPNGHLGTEKCNGHSKVMHKSPSKRDAETIEYIDSD